jgi:AcrR family transcriptional regulator
VILRVATDLFARKGFDAVSVRAVADAAGVDVATVHHHAGGKLVLYQSCFAQVFEAERRALEPVIAAASDGDLLAALHRVLDAFVDFLEERPETTGLWLRRWLEPERHAGLDERYSMPLYEQVERVLAAADKAGVLHEPQPHLAVRSLIWAVHAHAVTGLHDGIPADSRFALRAFVHRWLDRMYGRP